MEGDALLERKLVTALFCDLVESTALGEALDPEILQRIQAGYFERMESVVSEFGGSVEKFAGDAVVAVFGVPKVHEDDALRAVLCAMAMQEAVRGFNDTLRPRLGVELAVRIGVATGEAIAASRESALATGDVMNTAARLEQAAEPEEILVGRETMLLTRKSMVYGESRSIRAKGKTLPVEAWPAVGEERFELRARAEFVGREPELERFAACLETAIREHEPQVVALLGEPGIGKSRLASEFAARASGRAEVLAGACLQYGGGTTWRPISQILQAEAGILESDDGETALRKLRDKLDLRHSAEEASLLEAQLAALVGARRTSSASASEVVWGLRRYIEALASERPTVLVLDDLHWAGPQLVELVDELVATLSGVPLVLILQGRPEMREKLAATLAEERALTLRLGALNEQEARALASALGGAVDETIVARAEGNPLFLEELTSMAREERSVGAALPYSVRALIAARLDLLPDEAKAAAQAAAVVGGHFWDRAVASMLEDPAWLGSALRMLRSRGLITEEAASSFPGMRQFRFHHALIGEVAYESVAKADRARLHRRAAAWLDPRAEERRDLLVGVAHHYERAFSFETELAPLGNADLKLMAATVRSLLAAAEWATLNAAVTEAIRLASRAAEIAVPSPELVAVARGRLAVCLVRAGRVEEAVEVAEEVGEVRARPEAAAFASLALAEAARDQGRNEAIAAHAESAIQWARTAGQPLVEAEALYILFWSRFWEGQILEAEEAGLLSAELAAQHGDLGLAARPLAFAGVSSMWRGEVALGEERTLRALEMAQQAATPSAIAAAHTAVGHIRRVQDRLEESIEHGRERVKLASEIGERFHVASGLTLSVAEPLIDLGRLDEAWEALEEALALALELGSSSLEGPARVRRARLLTIWGRFEEAEAELEAMQPGKGTGADDHAAARAELLAARGLDVEAEKLWREVLARLPALQTLDRAELALPFAAFLVRRDRLADARRMLDELHELVDGTGAALLQRQLLALDDELAGRQAKEAVADSP